MKKIIILTLLWAVTIGCSEEEVTPVDDTPISFTGNWSRQFEAGEGNWHTVTYSIYQDSIRYKLSGLIGNANYVLHRDRFQAEDNRFIGHTSANQYYLIFAKNITTDSIAIYKQQINSIDEGLTIAVPNANSTENHGWNTYHK